MPCSHASSIDGMSTNPSQARLCQAVAKHNENMSCIARVHHITCPCQCTLTRVPNTYIHNICKHAPTQAMIPHRCMVPYAGTLITLTTQTWLPWWRDHDYMIHDWFLRVWSMMTTHPYAVCVCRMPYVYAVCVWSMDKVCWWWRAYDDEVWVGGGIKYIKATSTIHPIPNASTKTPRTTHPTIPNIAWLWNIVVTIPPYTKHD